jgi:hypothetical protein
VQLKTLALGSSGFEAQPKKVIQPHMHTGAKMETLSSYFLSRDLPGRLSSCGSMKQKSAARGPAASCEISGVVVWRNLAFQSALFDGLKPADDIETINIVP